MTVGVRGTGLREAPEVGRASRRARLRADRAIADEYERLRAGTVAALRSKLRRTGVELDDADLDAAYNQAWHTLHAKLAGGEVIENLGGFLTQAAYYRSVDEYRRLHPDRRADVAPEIEIADDGPSVDDRMDDTRRLREVMEGLRLRLGERERKAAALCYLHGYTRPQAAAVLGVSASRMEKIMDGVSKSVAAITAQVAAGRWCEEQRSLITAYALDVLDRDGERYPLALSHLRGCAACRALVRELRGIAALVPPTALPWAALGVGAGGVGGLAASAQSDGGTAGSSGSGRRVAREGRRTGALVAAAIAACLALAGGAVALTAGGSGGDDGAPAGSASGAVPSASSAPSSASAGSSSSGSSSGSSSTASSTAAAERRQARRAKARRAARRERARRTAARRRAAARAAATPPAAPAAPPVVAAAPTTTATTAAPAATAAESPTAPAAPARTASPPDEPEGPVTDAAGEFGLEPEG